MIPLSVLDQTPIPEGVTPAQALANSIDLARHCETLGYQRFWLAEHHASQALAGSAPEILIGAVANATSRIRVGSGGVMLPHYSALKVAEQFRVLDAIAPGRIDLGLGRAPGSDGRTAFALNPRADTAADEFPAAVRDLIAERAALLTARAQFIAQRRQEKAAGRRQARAEALDALEARHRQLTAQQPLVGYWGWAKRR